MVWRFGKFGQGVWDSLWDGETPVYVWNFEVLTGAHNLVPVLGSPGQGGSEPTDGTPAALAIDGTPGPDVFVLDKSTLAAATAVPPSVVLIPDYKASEGDLIDFSSLLQVSYAPLPADAVQLRVAEDASAAFATLQLNVGSAANPFWTAVAKLDGVHAGDAVHVSLDATHTVHLSAGWLV
jgi:hypothetical protein